MKEKFLKYKKRIIVGSSILIAMIIFGTMNQLISEQGLALTKLEVGQCLVQYNSCAFLNEEGETWEKSCTPIFKTYQALQVGDKKVLLKDLALDDYKAVYPKILLRQKSSKKEDAITNSLYLYAHDCTSLKKDEIAVPEKAAEQKKEESSAVTEDLSNKDKFPGGTWDSLNDHCVVEKKDCSDVERWEQDKYCHPYLASYKILEVGNKNLRVVVWHGSGIMDNGKPQVIGQESMLTNEEYMERPFVVSDCGELVTKYSKKFNPIKGK